MVLHTYGWFSRETLINLSIPQRDELYARIAKEYHKGKHSVFFRQTL